MATALRASRTPLRAPAPARHRSALPPPKKDSPGPVTVMTVIVMTVTVMRGILVLGLAATGLSVYVLFSLGTGG